MAANGGVAARKNAADGGMALRGSGDSRRLGGEREKGDKKKRVPMATKDKAAASAGAVGWWQQTAA